jgi:hypothetical protein
VTTIARTMRDDDDTSVVWFGFRMQTKQNGSSWSPRFLVVYCYESHIYLLLCDFNEIKRK